MVAYQIEDRYPKTFNIHQMINMRITASLYKVIGTNRHVALVNQNGYPLDNISELVVIEENKVPLYKQTMELQMGHKPKMVTQSRKVLRLQQLDITDDHCYQYKIYRASLNRWG